MSIMHTIQPRSRYIQLMAHYAPEKLSVRDMLCFFTDCARKQGSHYLRKEDAKMQAILLCIQTGKTIQDADRMEFQTDEFYVKTTDALSFP